MYFIHLRRCSDESIQQKQSIVGSFCTITCRKWMKKLNSIVNCSIGNRIDHRARKITESGRIMSTVGWGLRDVTQLGLVSSLNYYYYYVPSEMTVVKKIYSSRKRNLGIELSAIGWEMKYKTNKAALSFLSSLNVWYS